MQDFRMKRKPPSQQPTPALCSERGPGDGIDPRDLLREAGRKKGGRKAMNRKIMHWA